MLMKKIITAGVLITAVLVILPVTAAAADLTVPELELITRGMWDTASESVLLSTRGRSEIQVGGGYKFGGSLQLGFESGDLTGINQDPPDWADYDPDTVGYAAALSDYLDSQTTLEFQGARITYRNMFDSYTDLSYFVGRNERLASAEFFPEYFGSRPITTKYQGYLYFPENEYRGIHTINGTGIQLSSSFGSDQSRTNLFLYQDSYLGEGNYSADIQFLANYDNLKLELFAGGSFPEGDYGLYRAGLMFYFSSGERGEFFSQVGVPYYKPLEEFNINNFYFLFEPRIHFDLVSVIMTLFWHPGYYLMETTGEEGSADIHFNLQFGDPLKSPLSGGLETNFTLVTETSSGQEFEITTTPYLSVVTSGVVWNFMVNLTVVPYELEEFVEGVIGIKAEF